MSKENDKENCSICIDELASEIDFKTLECNHSFHKSCIEDWISRACDYYTCPLCMRVYLLPHRSSGTVVININTQGSQFDNNSQMSRSDIIADRIRISAYIFIAFFAFATFYSTANTFN